MVKDSLIYSSGELLSRAVPFFLLPYLTRSLGVEGFGELAYYQVIILLMIIFVGLSQETAVSKYYFRYGNRTIGNVVAAGLLLNMIVSSAIIIIAIFLKAPILALLTFCASTQVALSVQMALKQCQKKSKEYVKVQLTNSLLSVFFTLILFELVYSNAENRLYAILLANILSFILAIILYKKRERFRIRFLRNNILIYLSFIVAFGSPLILHKLSLFSKGQLDRILIESAFDTTALGVYAAAGQLSLIVFIMMISINKALTPYYFEFIKKKRINTNQILKLSFILFVISPIPAIVYYLLPQAVYEYILGEGYSGVGVISSLLVLGYSLYLPYYPLVNYFFYEGKTGLISIITVISGVFHVILILYLSKYSVEAMASAMIFSNLILYFLLLFYFFKLCKGSKNENF